MNESSDAIVSEGWTNMERMPVEVLETEVEGFNVNPGVFDSLLGEKEVLLVFLRHLG
jgi:hypothetical protein